MMLEQQGCTRAMRGLAEWSPRLRCHCFPRALGHGKDTAISSTDAALEIFPTTQGLNSRIRLISHRSSGFQSAGLADRPRLPLLHWHRHPFPNDDSPTQRRRALPMPSPPIRYPTGRRTRPRVTESASGS
jgi:hypothetical protein